jgi:hypothetical protein
MPAIASIAIPDGQPTPVTRTFTPTGVNADMVAMYDNRAGGVAVGYDSLSVSLRKPNSRSTQRNYKATLKLALPTLEVTSPATGTGIQPAPTKAYDCMAVVEFVLPERSTTQERKNLLTLLKNALAHAQITPVIENLENVY